MEQICRPIPLIFSGGEECTENDRFWNTPSRQLVPLATLGEWAGAGRGYIGLSRLVGGGNELINPQGEFNVTSVSGGEFTQQLSSAEQVVNPGEIGGARGQPLADAKRGPEKGPRRRAAKKALKSPTELLPKMRAYRPTSS